MNVLTLITCVAAGIGAGIGTGFAGLSAAAFIAPLLIGIVGVPAYQATGIGLASDVLASAVSAWTYHKAGNIDWKNGRSLLAMVLIGTAAGSLIAQAVSNGTMGFLSIAGSFFLGGQQLWQVLHGKEKRQRSRFRIRRPGGARNAWSADCGSALSAVSWAPAAV